MQSQPSDFWAKLVRSDRGIEWHPLIDHCADVAAVCESLLERTLLGRRLARLAAADDLDRVQVERLCVLAALHDAGKFNQGFQNKALERPAFRSGHLWEILAPLLTRQRYVHRQRLLEALAAEELASWTGEEGLVELLIATFSHHGRPLDTRLSADLDDRWWASFRGLDPIAGVAELVAHTRRWFPLAWTRDGSRLPAAAAFTHGWAGLLMLADWLGSDSERFFPFGDGSERMPFAREAARRAVMSLCLDPAASRSALGSEAPGYERLWPSFSPRPVQARMLDLPLPPEGGLTVLEAATGAGKTEAALVHYLRLFHARLVDGLYFALPTRTAATQIYDRVCTAIANAFPQRVSRAPVVLAVPGYFSVDGTEGTPLPPYRVAWPGDLGKQLAVRGWAAESSKRYLAGAVVVGTIDQILLSALMVSHAHLRGTALLRQLLVVDEVHASDAYMTRTLESVLDQHLAAGGHALLMSATLGTAAMSRLLAAPARRKEATIPTPEAAATSPFPAITFAPCGGASVQLAVDDPTTGKTVTVDIEPTMELPDEIAWRALDAARRGAHVLVVRNTVGGCCDVQERLEALAGSENRLLFSCEGVPAPHHSRFAAEDRQRLDAAIEHQFGKARAGDGTVAIATQTVEQSLDLDADLLITDLAPMDVLLQRIGRLHRHQRTRPQEFATARVVVLVPLERDLGRRIGRKGTPRGPHGIGTVYEDLRGLEATWRTLEATPLLDLPRDNRRLVEAGTHPSLLDDLTESAGDRWLAHQNYLFGGRTAERRLAELNRLPRDRAFADGVAFPSGDERRRIPTRLGQSDRRIEFPEPFVGPFGAPISVLNLPAHLAAPDLPDDLCTAERVGPCSAGTIMFRFGGRSYVYDRLGLRRVSAESADA